MFALRGTVFFAQQAAIDAQVFPDAILGAEGTAHAAAQAVPDRVVVQDLDDPIREVLAVAGAKMQAIGAIANFLGHAANVGADDRPAVQQRFLDDDGEFSHQIDGKITQSTERMSFGRSAF